jgi:hypothetical protein
MKQRPIKFRAWDGTDMLFTDKDQFYLMNNGSVDIPSSTGHEFKNKNYPVMQFTGLHDKNGQEIYESDLVKRHNITYEVVWYKAAWHLKNEDEKAVWYQAFCNGANATKIEVIGNIYQNE